MIPATIAWTAVVDALQLLLGLDQEIRYVSMEQWNALSFGGLLGTAYILGELPNSFIKRQLDIAPGAAAKGILNKLFWCADQIDSSLAILMALCLIHPPSLELSLYIIGLTLVVHPAVAGIMVMLGLKRRGG